MLPLGHGLGFLYNHLKRPLSPSPQAIHGKNLVAILHLLVSLATHFRAPIRLPEHVSVQVVVVRVSIVGRWALAPDCAAAPTFSCISPPSCPPPPPHARRQEATFYVSLLTTCPSRPAAPREAIGAETMALISRGRFKGLER